MAEDRLVQIGILGATFETQNLGVSALAAGTIKCVLSQYPQARVFFLDYGRESTVRTLLIEGRQVRVPLVNMRFSKKFYLPNNIAVLLFLALVLRIIPFGRARKWLLDRNSCLQEIWAADLFASIAGGDSFSDIYGLRRFLYVSLPQLLIILLGKRLVLLPQTYGPFRSELSRVLARCVIRHSEKAFSRDRQGLPLLATMLNGDRRRGQCEFRYDVGFAVDPIAPASMGVVGLSLGRESGSGLVGLNISGLLAMGGYSRNNAFGLQVDYQELIYALIDLLISRNGAAVLLVPHVLGNEEDSESDVPVCEKVFATLRDKYCGKLGLVRGSYNQSEVKYIIGRCDFFIGSRMHACIAAISQHVPAIAIAYSDKFTGVMEASGLGTLVADARKLGNREIVDLICRSYETRGATRGVLENKMREVRQSVLGLFAGIPLAA